MQTFKVGDWVVEIHSEEIHQIIELFPDVCRVIKPVSKITYSAEYTDFKPWQPLLGEWCWFWDNKYNIDLRKFHRYSEEENIYFADNGVVYVSYNFCEPFIGQLPTILQFQSKG